MIDYIIENINKYDADFLKQNVSNERIEKSNRYKHEDDRLRSLLVEYVLNRLIKKHFPDVFVPVNITYDSYGKPSVDIKSHSGVHISLSHSGEYVAAMIADSPCGIDIEKTNRSINKIATRYFTADELDSIKTDTDYFHIWTLKESIMKATGKGLVLGMDSYSVAGKTCTIKGITYECHALDAPDGYALSYVIEI